MTVYADVWPPPRAPLADLGVIAAVDTPRGAAVCTSCGALVADMTWAWKAHEGFHRRLGWVVQLAQHAADLVDDMASDRQNELTEANHAAADGL